MLPGLAPSFIPPIVTTIAASDIVGWWDFDEGAGTSLADKSGNGHTATAFSTTWAGDGPGNNPLGLNFVPANNTYVNYGFDPFYADGTALVWFGLDDTVSSQLLFGKGNFGGDWDIWANSGVVHARSRVGGTDRDAVGVTALTTGTPFFAAYSWTSSTSSDAINLYVNGALDKSAGGNWGSLNNTSLNIVSGRRTPTDASYELSGRIYQAALFGRVLSAAEIATIYNNGAGGRYQDFLFT